MQLGGLYDQDFYAWAMENAELLWEGQFSEIDVEHVADRRAVRMAAADTELKTTVFPISYLWTLERAIDEDFWPA